MFGLTIISTISFFADVNKNHFKPAFTCTSFQIIFILIILLFYCIVKLIYFNFILLIKLQTLIVSITNYILNF